MAGHIDICDSNSLSNWLTTYQQDDFLGLGISAAALGSERPIRSGGRCIAQLWASDRGEDFPPEAL